MQRELGLARISAAEGDTAGLRASAGNVKKIDLEGRRREQTQKLMAMKPQEIVQTYGERFNADPNAPLMIDFDEGSGKYMLVSRADGIQSQMLSPAEMTQALMGAWEAGNGDVSAGLEMMVKAGVTQRGLQDRAFERSDKLAGRKAEAHFKTREANNDDARTGIAREALGIQRQRAAADAKKDREIDPKLVAQLNDLSTRISSETDPNKRAVMEGEYARLYGVAATSIGKVIAPKVSKPEFTPEGYATVVEKLGGTPQARIAADELFGRTPQGGGLDASLQKLNGGAGKPPASSAPRQPRVVPNRTPEQQAAYDQSVRDDQERAVRQQQSQRLGIEARGINAAAIRAMPPEQAAATLQRLGPALGLQQRSALELRAQGR
jgi:hypothetical protein